MENIENQKIEYIKKLSLENALIKVLGNENISPEEAVLIKEKIEEMFSQNRKIKQEARKKWKNLSIDIRKDFQNKIGTDADWSIWPKTRKALSILASKYLPETRPLLKKEKTYKTLKWAKLIHVNSKGDKYYHNYNNWDNFIKQHWNNEYREFRWQIPKIEGPFNFLPEVKIRLGGGYRRNWDKIFYYKTEVDYWVDAQKFVFLKNWYATDTHSIYYKGKIIEGGVDILNFKVLKNWYATDTHDIFYNGIEKYVFTPGFKVLSNWYAKNEYYDNFLNWDKIN